MARPAGSHTAYRPQPGSPPFVALGQIITFTTDREAMLYALRADPPMRYVYWPFGMTLADAITADETEQRDELAKPATRTRAPRTPADGQTMTASTTPVTN